jgi:hypothetical protein
MVVLTIVVILAAMLGTRVAQVREAARRMSCHGHLCSIGIGIHTYQDIFMRFPTPTFRRSEG